MYRLIRETSEDRWEVEGLYDLCFAPGRERCRPYRLREGAAAGGQTWASWRAILDESLPVRSASGRSAGPRRGVLLVPSPCIRPGRGARGGGLLMGKGLARAAADRWPRVLLVGDAPYYGPSVVTRLEGVEMPPPTNPARFCGMDEWSRGDGPVTPWAHLEFPQCCSCA